MDNLAPTTSRRAMLGALTATTIATVAPSWRAALVRVQRSYDDDPVTLIRTVEGRALSRARYRRAEEFFPSGPARPRSEQRDLLYHAGITAQLGLSAHLLDVGFPDAWCARHIGLRVAKSLGYANATALGHNCPDMARLADVLSPYRKWNEPCLFTAPPDDGGFTAEQVRTLLRALLDRVRLVTGHARLRLGREARHV
ncbi:hypothetical protein ACFO8O_12685 [Hephaestia sp. GCM10023244]|uniref:hypothetical protein n=1 Tax=unclassified Hephaestia TaxID=2631281 RepID=UPI00207705E3|nr:hypothetical protein [Hephaestia sp. MAHUQ-44]MCM8731817.1 hypothetical protein [Hephaestia sp. MAHUQ-44]